MSFVARHRKKLIALGLVVTVPLAAHFTVAATTGMDAPAVSPKAETMEERDGIRFVGPAYARVREGVREVYLEGNAEELGARHVRLLRDRMMNNEGDLWGTFAHFVPIGLARTLIMDISRVQFRHVDQNIPEARKREMAAQAEVLAPDPFASKMPTYQRIVFLHTVYDIALSFEHSPLIGCSAFALAAPWTRNGHVLVGRAFDFEAGDVFDTDKAVFFTHEDGRIPYASVGWPGLTGVLTGMNLEGVMVLVNGGRARDPRTTGIPVVFSLREVLQSAHDTDEAVSLLAKQEIMVSHIVFVADAKGNFAVVERAPGVAATVRRTFADPTRVAVTNHFEGDLADDPRNVTVRNTTTTLPRRARLDEMLAALKLDSVDDTAMVGMLRDHTCSGGVACPLGDRRAIDALIATHGVVADTTDRTLWVSKGPHLSGQFVRFDLKEIFAPGHDPRKDAPAATVPADPILTDGRYEAGRAHAGGPRIGGDAKK